jgi:hypothetical protein
MDFVDPLSNMVGAMTMLDSKYGSLLNVIKQAMVMVTSLEILEQMVLNPSQEIKLKTSAHVIVHITGISMVLRDTLKRLLSETSPESQIMQAAQEVINNLDTLLQIEPSQPFSSFPIGGYMQ